ncbi:amidase domain-containing protein [Clostridium malenominatum]|uniref:Amidase domain-containing protein n=1 Tax=Clostridium malenominatum TaxID=1539 RepID=A0ABN1IXG8_9CLOT
MYNRKAAVLYAKEYALKPNPKYRYFSLEHTGGDCTNFVSQCLLAGGAPLIYNREHSWWYNSKNTANVMDDSWSLSWAIAHSFYWFLKVNEEKNLKGAKGREVKDVNLLELGDLVFFQNTKGTIYHSSIITDFLGNVPLISQHTFEALNIPYHKNWIAHKIHLLKISI